MSSSFNVTRLGEYLLDSLYTPEDVKEAVARKMKSKKAKQYVEQIDARGQRRRSYIHQKVKSGT